MKLYMDMSVWEFRQMVEMNVPMWVPTLLILSSFTIMWFFFWSNDDHL